MAGALIYTEEELAEHLKVPRKTVTRWRAVGTGPKWFRAGRYVRYRESAVQEWAAAQEDETAPRASA